MLSLFDNNFTGSIPSEIGIISTLKELVLGSNSFEGEISPEFSKLTNLEIFMLSDNKLIGIIPEEIQNLPHLVVLESDSQTHFEKDTTPITLTPTLYNSPTPQE